MSNPSPADYSTTDVLVSTAPGAQVTTTAHYKTTDTTHSQSADASGHTDIAYRISRATPGFTVSVDVTVTIPGASQTCQTSFTPVP
jgi:N-acetylglutamate synthase/N-acetylornithine aminotransferase